MKKPTRAERYKAVQILRDQGMTHQQIATSLGLSRSYIASLLADPNGTADKERKRRHHGTCIDCGDRTYNGGSRNRPKRCSKCSISRDRESKYWTKERIVQAIKLFAWETGRRPQARDFLSGRRHYMPSLNSLYGPHLEMFPTFNAAIEAAGLEPEPRGKYNRSERDHFKQRRSIREHAINLARAGHDDREIALQTGLHHRTVGTYRRQEGIYHRARRHMCNTQPS